MPRISPDFELSDFCKAPAAALRQLRKTRRQIVLTVKGKPELVLLHPSEHERIMTLARQADENEAIRQGLAAVAAGHTRPAREVFAELRKKYNIPPHRHP
ncbi:MAG: prevent-host-death protein [Acidobacteriaceae bacterium]|nr:prevent-host-death protein [Acidobacteriaceae bacterium]